MLLNGVQQNVISDKGGGGLRQFVIFLTSAHLLGKMQINRTNNLHHRKAVSVAGFLGLRVGFPHMQKNKAIILSTLWHSNIQCIFQGQTKQTISSQFELYMVL